MERGEMGWGYYLLFIGLLHIFHMPLDILEQTS